jgi:hypothetical protein
VTLEELEDSLPNGFHDAILLQCTADYEGRRAEFTFRVDISEPEQPEGRRDARVVLRGLEFFAIDPPPSGSQRLGDMDLLVSAGPGQPDTARLPHLTIPDGTFAHWFFVSSWNSFIRVVAREAELHWLSPGSEAGLDGEPE